MSRRTQTESAAAGTWTGPDAWLADENDWVAS